MRVLVNARHGGPEVLVVEERPTPTPPAGKVRLRVERSGLNFADVAARVGLYPDAPKPPMVLGYEVAGVVDEVGQGVTELAQGDRVLALTHFGGHASHVVVTPTLVRRIPAAMSFDAAAAIPVNYLTALHMLRYVAPVQPGMSVLLQMAAGGVGLAALEILKAIGGVTVLARASTAKHALLQQKGATHCLDSRAPYVDEVRALTGGRGVDRVIDALGGADWKRGYELLAPAGHLVCFGWANMVPGTTRQPLHVAREFLRLPLFNPMQLMSANKAVSGVNLGHLWTEAKLMGGHLDALLELFSRGALAPHVDSVIPLSDAKRAHERLQSRASVGKVLFDCQA